MADSPFVTHEAFIRLAAFGSVLALLVLWERWAWAVIPAARICPARRWSSNYGMGLLDTLIVRLIFPAGAVTVAILAVKQHLGLFNHLPFTGFGALAVSVLL